MNFLSILSERVDFPRRSAAVPKNWDGPELLNNLANIGGWIANETKSQATVPIKIPKLGHHKPGHVTRSTAYPQSTGCLTGSIFGGTRRGPERGTGDTPEGPATGRSCHAGSVVD